MITPLIYVPLLRWRMGEYQALMHLEDLQKDHVVPLIEVLKPGYDFEEERPKKNIDQHLEKFGVRLARKWGLRPVLLDGGRIEPSTRMKDGRHPIAYMFDEAHARGVPVIPVTAMARDDDYHAAVRRAAVAGERGVALRCSLHEAFDDFDAGVATILGKLGMRLDQLDIIIDLESPNFDPIDGLVATVVAALQASEAMLKARSTTVIANSFPKMADVKKPTHFWPRQEWLLFKALLGELPEHVRPPAYGDYGIDTVDITEGDMRLIKTSANVRYTVNDGWLIVKGLNTRDHGFDQYRAMCGEIIELGHYLGAGFSTGSGYLEGCRKGTKKTGNQSTWKWVGTNHHITKVVHDLAILHEP